MDGAWSRHGQGWADLAAYLGQPDADAGQVAAAFDSMVEGHRLDGSSPRATTRLRARYAALIGDAHRAAELAEQAAAEPLDDECSLCDLRERAEALADLAPDQALELIDALIGSDQVCPLEPGRALALAARLHARLGDADAALDAHLVGWRLVRDDDAEIEAVTRHVDCLLLIGEVERAATYVLARRSWIESDRTPMDQLDLASTGVAALRAARHHATVPEGIGDADAVSRIADQLEARATHLAADFDTRFATGAFSQRLRERLHTEAPLEPARLPPLETRAPLTAIDLSGVSVTELRTRLDDYLDTLDPRADDVVTWWLDQRGTLIPTTTDLAALSELDRVASRVLEGTDRVALLRHARECAVRIHDEVLVDLADADLALATQPPELAETAIREIADDLVNLGNARAAADVMAGWADDPNCPHTVDALLAAAKLLDGQGANLDQAHHLVAAGSALVGVDPARAKALLDRAGALNGVIGHAYLATEIRAQRGRLAWGGGDLATADRLLLSSTTQPGTPPATLLPRLLDLCEIRAERSDWPGVTDTATRLADLAADEREPLVLALAQRYLAFAALEAGRPYAAADLLEVALPVITRDEPDLAGSTAFALGSAMAEIGDLVRALTGFDSATEVFGNTGQADAEAEAALRAGDVMLLLGDADGAETRFRHCLEKAGQDTPMPTMARVGLVHAALGHVRLDEGALAARELLTDLDGEQWIPQREALIGTVATALETAGRTTDADEWWALLVE